MCPWHESQVTLQTPFIWVWCLTWKQYSSIGKDAYCGANTSYSWSLPKAYGVRTEAACDSMGETVSGKHYSAFVASLTCNQQYQPAAKRINRQVRLSKLIKRKQTEDNVRTSSTKQSSWDCALKKPLFGIQSLYFEISTWLSYDKLVTGLPKKKGHPRITRYIPSMPKKKIMYLLHVEARNWKNRSSHDYILRPKCLTAYRRHPDGGLCQKPLHR